MRDEYEITPEEQESFMEWWEAHIPKEYVTILNAKSYAEATQAISKIYIRLSSAGNCVYLSKSSWKY